MIGILAYGSLISVPGAEIVSARIDTIRDVMTPFHVEYARSSTGRGGAPTLVPVTSGGSHVRGQVFVMDLSEADATDMLYRRERDKVGEMDITYARPVKVRKNSVIVERLTKFAGLDVVLYTQIGATIEPLTADNLADLAMASVKDAPLEKDGITYLKNAKESGIVTALSPSYEAEILRKTESSSLEEALVKLKA